MGTEDLGTDAPPESLEEGWKLVEGKPDRWRYWDGKQWTDRYKKVETAGGLIYSLRIRLVGEGPAKLVGIIALAMLIFVLLIVILWAIASRGGDDESPGSAEGEGVTPVGAGVEATVPACGPGMVPVEGHFDAGPGIANCVPAGGAEENPATPPAATASPAQPGAGAQTSGDCALQTFTGTVDANLEGKPVGATQHAVAEVVVAPDCSASVDFVWLESGASDAYYSATNPDGNFCAMVEGEGKLTFTPDGRGGGTLAGTMTVYPNIASSASFEGLCPPVDRVGSYVLEGVNGEFTATVSAGTLSGSGTFAHRQLPVGVSITAAVGAG